MTAIDRNSKPDTTLLLLGLAGPMTLGDVSQYRTPITDAGGYGSEAPSARTAIAAPREVSIVVDVAAASSGTLVEHGNGGGYSYRVTIAAGVVLVAEAGAVLASVTIPGIVVAARKILIHWSQRPEGVGVRSEVMVYNYTTTGLAFAVVDHALTAPNGADDLTIAAAWGGGAPYSGGLAAFYSLRIGRRFHSTTEGREDWIAERVPPAVTQVRPRAPLVPERASLDVASDGSFVGPAHLWSGHGFECNARRLVGPLVNVRPHTSMTIAASYYPAAWWRLAPGSSTMHLCVSFLWYRPIPGKVDRARVRLHVTQFAALEPLSAPVQYQAYSMANLPTVDKPLVLGPGEKPAALDYRRSAIVSRNVNDGVGGAGAWIELTCPLVRDAWGCSWLAVAFSIDNDSGSPLSAITSSIVRAVTWEPFASPVPGGLDIALP